MVQGVNTITGTAVALDGDAQLMLRVREGDEASYGVLLEKYRSPVIRFVYRMVQDQAIAEELGQEVFLRVYRSRASYEPTAKFTTWLFRIATHLALNWLRDGKSERGHQRLDDEGDGEMPVREVADRRPSVEQRMVYQTRLQEVRDAIALLPEKLQELIARSTKLQTEVRRLDNTMHAPAPVRVSVGNPVERQMGLLRAAFEQDSV